MSPRQATLTDLDALVPLLDGYRVFYGQAPDRAAARDFLSRRLTRGDSRLLVHEDDDGTLLGFVQLYPLFSTVGLAPQWLLNDLFVAPEARRRGVGRALMRGAEALARSAGVARLTLATQVENRTAKALYESLGWRCDRIFDHYRLDLATT